MQELTLKRTRFPLSSPEDDFCVYCDGVGIGRIYKQHWVPPSGNQWHWAIQCLFHNPDYPDASPYRWKGRPDTGGTASSLDDAKAQFKTMWEVCNPDLESWREHMVEVDARAAAREKRAMGIGNAPTDAELSLDDQTSSPARSS